MTIEVPAEVVDATYDRVLNRLASRAKIEGFRPGKAPRALVEARIGSAGLREGEVGTLVPRVVPQSPDGKSTDPIAEPRAERPARGRGGAHRGPAGHLRRRDSRGERDLSGELQQPSAGRQGRDHSSHRARRQRKGPSPAR